MSKIHSIFLKLNLHFLSSPRPLYLRASLLSSWALSSKLLLSKHNISAWWDSELPQPWEAMGTAYPYRKTISWGRFQGFNWRAGLWPRLAVFVMGPTHRTTHPPRWHGLIFRQLLKADVKYRWFSAFKRSKISFLGCRFKFSVTFST